MEKRTACSPGARTPTLRAAARRMMRAGTRVPGTDIDQAVGHCSVSVPPGTRSQWKIPITSHRLQAGQAQDRHHEPCSAWITSYNTQIYEGTNQIQRMVMARQLLK